MFDKLLEFVVNAVRSEEQRKHEKLKEVEDKTKAIYPASFTVEVAAGALIEPSRKNGKFHREREKYYSDELEKSETELREKGITIDVFDQQSQSYMNYGVIVSGALPSSNANQQVFQPRVDQKLMDNVKHAKSKMLEHRGKAEQFEKYVRAFQLDRNRLIKLTIEEVHYFRLGEIG